jgi:DNA-binding NarL/FixJ family response regulator
VFIVACHGHNALMTHSSHIRILSVDDHPLMREGIAALIGVQPDMRMVAQAESGREAVEKFREHRPDVTLMDLRLPDMGGIEATIAILGEFPDAKIVMLTTFEGDVEINRALAAGARGYVLKSTAPHDLAQMIRRVHVGQRQIPPDVAAQLAEHLGEETLTGREQHVLRHVAAGNRNRDIAQRLAISEDTVKVHVKHIMAKLGAADRTGAVTIALRRGIIEL